MTKPIINPEAFKTELGPALLLAGPGTGKTWQLAKRIQHLTDTKSVPAEEITVITFTSEAANSMRRKIEEEGKDEYIEPDKRPKRISTMHSLGLSILKKHQELVGLQPDFIVVENQQLREMLMRDAALLLRYGPAQAKIAMRERTAAALSEVSGKIVDKYEKILRLSNAIDYDDQITLAVKLLNENEEVRQEHIKKTKHLLVDEYQDINQAQFEFIELLSRESRGGLFVVGDDDQSIYGFRGGDPKFIRSFTEHFGDGCVVYQIDVSRRCAPNILDSAVSVVANFDTSRVDKCEYKYTNAETGKVVIHNCPSDDREAEVIAAIIFGEIEAAKEGKRIAGGFFILVPNRFYAESVGRILRRGRIFLDQRSAKENSGFQKVALFNDWRLKPELNLAARMVVEMILESGSTSTPSPKGKEDQQKRTEGMKQVAELWEVVSKNDVSFLRAMESVAKKGNLYQELSSKMQELLKLSKGKDTPRFLEKMAVYIRPWGSPESFLEGASKANTPIKNTKLASGHTARILTFQSAKGLEADFVFIVGLEEGTMPRSADGDVSEEARLFFVAMTRAKKELHLFHCRKRTGAVTLRKSSHNLSRSRFLEKLPKDKFESQYHQPKK